MQLQEQMNTMLNLNITLQTQVELLQPQPQTMIENNMRQIITRILQMYNHMHVELLQMNKLMFYREKILVPQSLMNEIQELKNEMQMLQQQQLFLQTKLELQPQLQLTEEMREMANLIISNEMLKVYLLLIEEKLKQLHEQMKQTHMKLRNILTLRKKQMMQQLSLIKIIMCKKQLPSQLLHLFKILLLPSEETQITIEMYHIREQILLTYEILSHMQLQLDHPLIIENMSAYLTHVQWMFEYLQDNYEQLLEQMEADED